MSDNFTAAAKKNESKNKHSNIECMLHSLSRVT